MRHPAQPRRELLRAAGGGIGMIALRSLLAADGTPSRSAAAGEPVRHDAAHSSTKPPHFPPRAKRMIWLFMHGGPSHVDLFDPKPELAKYSGKPLPESFGEVMTRRDVANNPLLAATRPFRPRGKSGLPVSDYLPQISELADDLCVIRSLHGDSVNHPQSVYQMNTGSILMGHPSVGSWLAYGLGTENADMPAFVVLPDPGGGLKGEPQAWGSGYLPASYQGTPMRPGATPILNLQSPAGIPVSRQRSTLDYLQQVNRRHLIERDRDDELEARIESYELAFRMQAAAPDAVDLT